MIFVIPKKEKYNFIQSKLPNNPFGTYQKKKKKQKKTHSVDQTKDGLSHSSIFSVKRKQHFFLLSSTTKYKIHD